MEQLIYVLAILAAAAAVTAIVVFIALSGKRASGGAKPYSSPSSPPSASSGGYRTDPALSRERSRQNPPQEVVLGMAYDPVAARIPRAVVTCVRGDGEGDTFCLNPDEEIVIGRDPACSQIVLSDPQISRRHCALTFVSSHNCYRVENFSENGTSSSGLSIRAGETRDLPRGSRLTLSGKTEYLLG